MLKPTLSANRSKDIQQITSTPTQSPDYSLDRSEPECFAKSVHAGQMSKTEALSLLGVYITNTLTAQFQKILRTLLHEKKVLDYYLRHIETDIADLEKIVRFLSPTKQVKRLVHKQTWAFFLKITVYLLLIGTILAGAFGVLNASKALTSTQVGFYGKDFQALVASVMWVIPPLAIKGLIAVLPEKTRPLLIRAVFVLLIVTLTCYMCLFAYVNAPTPITTGGDLFGEELSTPSRWPSILLLFFQLALEMSCSSALMAVAVVLTDRHTQTMEEDAIVDNPDYHAQKAKLIELQSQRLKIAKRLDLIESYVDEHDRRVQAVTTEAKSVFYQTLRSI